MTCFSTIFMRQLIILFLYVHSFTEQIVSILCQIRTRYYLLSNRIEWSIKAIEKSGQLKTVDLYFNGVKQTIDT